MEPDWKEGAPPPGAAVPAVEAPALADGAGDDWAEAADGAEAADTAAPAGSGRRRPVRERREALKERLEAMIRRAEEVTARGDLVLKDRQKVLAELTAEWKEVAEEAQALHLRQGDRVRQIMGELANDLDWERWSHSKLKEDLCNEARALQSMEDGAELARRVMDLHARWKEIGPSFREDGRLWQGFRAACDAAFERAREQFKVLDEQRAANTVVREALCAEAESMSGSEQWTRTMDAYKQLQERWQAAGPATREKGGELEKRFRKACNVFFRRRREHVAELDAKREENLAAKTRLCEKAEALPRLGDWRKALPEAKNLQAQWKATGPAPAERSDEIWKRFKEACDKVYALKRAEDEKRDGEARAAASAREELCAELERRVAVEDPEALAREMEAHRRSFSGGGRTSARDAGRLRERFHQVEERLQQRLAELAAQRERQREEGMRARAALCRELEEAIAAGNLPAPERVAELRKAWKQAGGGTGEADLAKRFEALLAWIAKGPEQARAAFAKAAAENGRQRERLVYGLERLAGIESPLADPKLRREFMAAELAARMGRGGPAARTPREEAAELRRQWQALGPAPEGARAALEERFTTAWEKIAGS